MAPSSIDSSNNLNVTQQKLDDAYGRFSTAIKDDKPVSLRDYKLSLWKHNGFFPYDTAEILSEKSNKINKIEHVSNIRAVVPTGEKTFDIKDEDVRDKGGYDNYYVIEDEDEDDNDDAIEAPPQAEAGETHKRKEVPSEQEHENDESAKKCKASNNSQSLLEPTDAISALESFPNNLQDRPTSTSKTAELQNEPVYRQPTRIETVLFDANSAVIIKTNEMLPQLQAGIDIIDGSDLMQDRIIKAFIAQLKTNPPENFISEEDAALAHRPTTENEDILDIELFNHGEYLIERGNKVLKNLHDVTNILARSVVGDETAIQQFFQAISEAQYKYFEKRHWHDFQECASLPDNHISQTWLQVVNE